MISKKFIRNISLALVGTIFMLAPVAPALAASTPSLASRPMFLLHGRSTTTSSTTSALTQSASQNWSGYAAISNSNTFNSVSSSWVQPSISCATGQTSYSAYWVGLDGFGDQTVEQIGTEANCINGQAQYYSWYEMYPQNPSEVITRLNVSPKDDVTATVVYNQPINSRYHFRNSFGVGSFTLSLTDNTTRSTYSTSQTSYNTANRSSAEVIAEAPYSNGTLPLSNFGTVSYTNSEINGSPLGNAPGLLSITMYDPYGMIATPSSLDSTKENFSVTWSN